MGEIYLSDNFITNSEIRQFCRCCCLFETLCGICSVKQLLDVLPTVCSIIDAASLDGSCDWSSAKHWAQWWARCNHLKMLSKSFSIMEDKIWKQCPTTTHAVEKRHKDCKSDVPQSLKLAMIKV